MWAWGTWTKEELGRGLAAFSLSTLLGLNASLADIGRSSDGAGKGGTGVLAWMDTRCLITCPSLPGVYRTLLQVC